MTMLTKYESELYNSQFNALKNIKELIYKRYSREPDQVIDDIEQEIYLLTFKQDQLASEVENPNLSTVKDYFKQNKIEIVAVYKSAVLITYHTKKGCFVKNYEGNLFKREGDKKELVFSERR